MQCASRGRICLGNFTCCPTKADVANQTCYLTQSQSTATGPTAPNADPITPCPRLRQHLNRNSFFFIFIYLCLFFLHIVQAGTLTSLCVIENVAFHYHHNCHHCHHHPKPSLPPYPHDHQHRHYKSSSSAAAATLSLLYWLLLLSTAYTTWGRRGQERDICLLHARMHGQEGCYTEIVSLWLR